MDWEAPADAWYVWLGVALASGTIATVVLGLPMGPPPDANAVANSIDRAAGSSFDAQTVQGHDAGEIKTDGKTISLRNDLGTTHSSVSYGTIVFVNGDERLENIARGTSFEDEFAFELDEGQNVAIESFLDRVENTHERNHDQWRETGDEIVVKTLSLQIGDTLSISAEREGPSTRGPVYTTGSTFEYVGDEDVTVTFEVTGWAMGSGRIETDRTTVQFREPTDSVELTFLSGRKYFSMGPNSDHEPIQIDAHVGEDITCSDKYEWSKNDGAVSYTSRIDNLCDSYIDVESLADEIDVVRVDDTQDHIHVTLVVV